ncbi:MAG: hypothetical protein IJ083_05760 [Clostridia bacterium]|nr:hypothetical protein [Clostridia bacterium]
MKKVADMIRKDLWVVLLDLVAVNASYYLALLIRFYVNSTFRPTVSYLLGDWGRFAPFYSVICLILFVAFRLYGGMWRYAGINDMNRIIGASLAASLLHVVGTVIFIRRMPITYYVIGAVLQFLFLAMIRFSYRILLVEKSKLAKSDKVPCAVVGSGDLARKVIRHLEENTPFRAALMIGKDAGRTMDGVPVLPLSQLGDEIGKRGIRAVFIADKELSPAERERIHITAEGLEVQDFTGALSNLGGSIPIAALLTVTSGKVTLVQDGKETQYDSGKAALDAISDTYDVDHIEGGMKVFIRKHSSTVDTAWLENYKATTGEDISFF